MWTRPYSPLRDGCAAGSRWAGPVFADSSHPLGWARPESFKWGARQHHFATRESKEADEEGPRRVTFVRLLDDLLDLGEPRRLHLHAGSLRGHRQSMT